MHSVHEARATATQPLVAGSGLGHSPAWQTALEVALDGALGPLAGQVPDLLLLFASDAYAPSFADLLGRAQQRSGTRALAGCSASGVIAGDRELEAVPAVAALALAWGPGTSAHLVRIEPDDLLAEGDDGPSIDWSARLGQAAAACTGLIVLADPFTTDVLALVGGLERAAPDVPVVGGLASGAPTLRQTHVFWGTRAEPSGAVVIALAGAVGLRPVVSQGAQPIGAPWTITDARGHVLRTIGNRPAYTVLVETLEQLAPAERQRAARNLLVGLAMNEYRDDFGRGDFLIRNLLGADPSSGALAVGAELHVGQTLQFQIRDAQAADDELRHMLAAAAQQPSGPAAALLFACNGRGAGLFGGPDHDARTTRELLGPVPLAGLFCNGEIGPVGQTTYLHGFTASLALITCNE
jgi:small ligand-binding sensory domain FIST